MKTFDDETINRRSAETLRPLSRLLICLLLILVIVPTPLAWGGGKQHVVELEGFQKAQIRQRVTPFYPQYAQDRNIEGWVWLQMVISPDGIVTRVDVIDSDPPQVFDAAGKQAVSQWVYDPATLNGTAVESTADIVLSFAFGDHRSSRNFVRHYKAAAISLENADFASALEELETLERIGTKSQREREFLNALFAQYYWRKGGADGKALSYLKAVTTRPWEFFSEAQNLEFLIMRFKLEAKLQHYSDAHFTFGKINSQSPQAPNSRVARLHNKVLEILNGSTPLSQAGHIKPNCVDCEGHPLVDIHNLYRPAFFIDQVNGHIETLKFYCGRHFAETPFDPALTWTISDQWGECSLHVEGQAGTTYRLVEINP